MKYRVGTTEHSPLTNVTLRGITFPRFTGPPGGKQVDGSEVELTGAEVNELLAVIGSREVRKYKGGGSAGICEVSDDGEGRPAVLSRVPLSRCVYLTPVDVPEPVEPE